MATKIEWTDETWNPVTGCTKVSAGCDHCYAEVMHERFNGKGSFATVQLKPSRLDKPLGWKRPRKVFVNSMSDLFHDQVPDEFIAKVFAVMASCPQHTFQLLTKRHARMRSLLNDAAWRSSVFLRESVIPGRSRPLPSWPLPNVWLGVSTEDQRWADIRIPALLETPAAVRWISAEPLLGPIDIRRYIPEKIADWEADLLDAPRGSATVGGLDWVVVGGESGHRARPMHPNWARSVRDQCASAGVPFFFKQWGEWGPAPWTVRVCDPAVGWQGTEEELAAAKADSEARGATHVYASWAHEYGHDLYQPPAKPWSSERVDPLDEHQAPMRKWGKSAAGCELDGCLHDEYPAVNA
ncbi:DUF5131 family protein [Amycolatopsis sp. NPDC059657]|uniref:DUF5131 family protein n=1 Tax=Amycolatopsis sp. NPDC059657 TaxID=3346899 RepID=UPI00367198F0